MTLFSRGVQGTQPHIDNDSIHNGRHIKYLGTTQAGGQERLVRVGGKSLASLEVHL